MNVITEMGESPALRPVGAEPLAQVYVWFCDIRGCSEDDALRQNMLDEFDKTKGQQAKVPELRRLILVGHAVRRLILARHLRAAKTEVRISYDSRGRPILCGSPLHMAYSDSGAMVAIALCREAAVGVDVEPVTSRETEVACTFSAAERATLGRMDAREAMRATLRTWCRKEALLKAFGLRLDDVLACGALADDDPRKWVAPRAVTGAWSLTDLSAPGDHVAAVAAVAPATAVVVEQVSGRDLLAPRRPSQLGRAPAVAGAGA